MKPFKLMRPSDGGTAPASGSIFGADATVSLGGQFVFDAKNVDRINF